MTGYLGHLPDGSSIQRHSAGPAYPFVVFAQEGRKSLVWGVMAPSGEALCTTDSAVEAQQLAEELAARRRSVEAACAFCGLRTEDACDEPPAALCSVLSEALLARQGVELRCGSCANSASHLLNPKCGLCDGRSHYKELA
jgi:hypothetical protein